MSYSHGAKTGFLAIIFLLSFSFASALPSTPDSVIPLNSITSGVLPASVGIYQGSLVGSASYINSSLPYYLNVTASSGYMRINVSSSSALQFGNARATSQAFWLYDDDDNTNNYVLKWGAGTPSHVCYIQWSSTGQWRCDLWDTGSVNTFPGTGLFPKENTWTLFVLTSDASNNIRSYICEIGGTVQTGNTFQPNAGNALRAPSADARLVGSDGGAPVDRIGGFGFWNTTLSSDNIQELCDLGVNYNLNTITLSTDYNSTAVNTLNISSGGNVFTYQLANVSANNPYSPRAACTGTSENCNVTQAATDTLREAYSNITGGLSYIRGEWSPQSIYELNNSYKNVQSNYANWRNMRTQVDWAYENNYGMIVTLAYLPTALNGTGGGICASNQDGLPSNQTLYEELAVQYLKDLGCARTLSNGEPVCKVELGNEPDLQKFYCDNESNRVNPLIVNAYITRTQGLIDAISSDSQLSSLKLIAPPISDVLDLSAHSYWGQSLLGNLTGVDYWGFHFYCGAWGNTGDCRTNLTNSINTYLSWCSTYGRDCSRLYLTEWGTYQSADQNGTNGAVGYSRNQMRISQMLTTMADRTDVDVQPVWYQFTGLTNASLGACGSDGRNMCAVQNPMTGYAYYSPYNVLKVYSDQVYGDSTYTCSTNDYSGGTECLVTREGNEWLVTLTNVRNLTKTVTVDVGNNFGGATETISGLSHIFTGSTFTDNLDPYEVVQYSLSPLSISVSSFSPANNTTITAGSSQLYSINYSNPSGTNVITSWIINGVNQSSLYGSSSILFSPGYEGEGTYTVVASGYGTNTVTNSWTLTVLAAECTVLPSGYGVLFRIILVLCIMLVGFSMLQLFGVVNTEISSIMLIAQAIAALVIAITVLAPIVTDYCLV